MSAKIDAINLNRGDGLGIRFEGSVQNAIFVTVDENGVPTIQGPINMNKRTFQVSVAGFREVLSETELHEEVAKRLREGVSKAQIRRDLGVSRRIVDAIDHYTHAPADAE